MDGSHEHFLSSLAMEYLSRQPGMTVPTDEEIAAAIHLAERVYEAVLAHRCGDV